jgi:hypothetical protein
MRYREQYGRNLAGLRRHTLGVSTAFNSESERTALPKLSRTGFIAARRGLVPSESWRALCVCLRGIPYCWYEIFEVHEPVGYVNIVAETS